MRLFLLLRTAPLRFWAEFWQGEVVDANYRCHHFCLYKVSWFGLLGYMLGSPHKKVPCHRFL